MEKMNAVNLEKMYEVLKFVEYGLRRMSMWQPASQV